MRCVFSSSSSSSSFSSSVFSLDKLPEEVFLNILSFVDKADNKTLASLASASKDCWRLVGVDGLRSYFYAAHASFSNASTEGKRSLLPVVIEWLNKVSDQMPAETRNQMWENLIDMTNIAELKPEDKFKISNTILESVKPLLEAELAAFTAPDANLEKRDRLPLRQLEVLCQKAAACYANATEMLNQKRLIENLQREMLVSSLKFYSLDT
jgi:hypothetical protein